MNQLTRLRQDLNGFVQEQSPDIERMLIGLKIAPAVPGPFSGQYPRNTILDTGLLQPGGNKARVRGTAFPRNKTTIGNDFYELQDFSEEETIDLKTIREYSRFFAMEQSASVRATRRALLGHERRIASIVQNTNNFNATGAVVAYTNANLATINFAQDILNAVDRLQRRGYSPDTIALSSDVASRIRTTTLLQNFLKPFAAGVTVATDSAIVAAFAQVGIRQLLIGTIGLDLAGTGSTTTLVPAWSNSHIWVGKVGMVPNGGNVYSPGEGAIRTIYDEGQSGPISISSYDDTAINSVVIRANHDVAEKVFDQAAGELITTNFA
jgi:hypothetical protein